MTPKKKKVAQGGTLGKEGFSNSDRKRSKPLKKTPPKNPPKKTQETMYSGLSPTVYKRIRAKAERLKKANTTSKEQKTLKEKYDRQQRNVPK